MKQKSTKYLITKNRAINILQNLYIPGYTATKKLKKEAKDRDKQKTLDTFISYEK